MNGQTRLLVRCFWLLPLAALASSPRVARADTDCTALTNPIFVSGSTEITSPLAVAAAAISGSETVVFFPVGACASINSALGTNQNPTTGSYWTSDGTKMACTLSASHAIDVAVSDVFPTSCPGITTTQLATAGLGDFQPFVETMVFVVPKTSTHDSICAEAAYYAIGTGDSGTANWHTPGALAVRNGNSATEIEIAAAIKVPTIKWKGVDQGSSGAMVAAMVSATDPDQTLGILSATEADPARSMLKELAYEAYDQTCAVWPDSKATTLDKAMVRDGHYQMWGPIHLLTKVSSQGVPSSTTVTALYNQLSSNYPVQKVIDAEIAASMVPTCAMTVQRTSEMGPMASVQPTCECYFEAKTGGAGAGCKACTIANEGTVCTGAASQCTLGFCEAPP